MLTFEVIKCDVMAVVTVQKGQVTLGECECGRQSHVNTLGSTTNTISMKTCDLLLLTYY